MALPSTNPSHTDGPGTPDTRAPGRSGSRQRRELIPANVFFVRLDGRVAAVLVNRGGQLRVQTGARERWRPIRVAAAPLRSRSGRVRLPVAGGDPVTVHVYGRHEAGPADLGRPRPQRARAGWRPATRRDRRGAADRFCGLLGH